MEMYVDTASIFYLNTYSQRFYIYRNRYKSYSTDVNLKSLEVNGAEYGLADLIYNDSSAQWVTQGISPSSYFYIQGGSAPNDQWLTEELVVQSSASNGVQPAVFRWCRNGTTCTNVGDFEADNIALRDDNNLMHRVAIAYHGDYNCGGACPTMGPERFDNLYLDNTWSRVMIGNANTFAASTQREIQVPTAWANGSITVSFNPGRFTAGQTAYLYVIDSNNVVNATGYSITIGGGGAGTPPTVSALTCTPTTIQSIGTTTCTATASQSPTSYEWDVSGCTAAQCSAATPTAGNSTTYTCLYGGGCSPCVTATNGSGSSAQFCAAANYLTVRYRQPTGFGAN
jgi:hypothetical protein